MNEQEQNIAIAESIGLRSEPSKVKRNALIWYNQAGGGTYCLPLYTSDLNAIMPLIAELPDLAKFAVELVHVVKGTEHFPQICMAEITEIQHTATAAQRAEAYLRTIGKWEEAT